MKYGERPGPIEAVRLKNTYESIHNVIEFISEKKDIVRSNTSVESVKDNKGISIPILDGTIKANFGDYIIKGSEGEFYPCKPDIFKRIYKEVN